MRRTKVPKLSHDVSEGPASSSPDHTARIASYEAQIASLKATKKAYKKKITFLTKDVRYLLNFKHKTEDHMYCLDLKGQQLEPTEVGRKIHANLKKTVFQFVKIMEAGQDQKYFTDKDVETITDSLHTFYDQFNKRLAMHELDRTISPIFKCPISHSVFEDPVSLSDGLTYERATIQTYFDRNLQNSEIRYKSPLTNLPLERPNITPNRIMKRHIEEEVGKLSKLLKADHTVAINSSKNWTCPPCHFTFSSDEDSDSDEKEDNVVTDPDYNG